MAAIITTRKQLKFYLMADSMMNTGVFKRTWKQRLKELILPNQVMRYLRLMRKLTYYKNKKNPLWLYYHWKYHKLGARLGFDIGHDVCGYGLVIHHYGTIIVGGRNSIGNYASLGTSTCITSTGKHIGDNLLLATGAKITTCQELGHSVAIAANSVVTKSFPQSDILLVGMPAVVKTERKAWYMQNAMHENYYRQCEELKKKLFA